MREGTLPWESAQRFRRVSRNWVGENCDVSGVLALRRSVTTVGVSVEAKSSPASATVYLDKLADELTNRGLEAWLMAPPGRVPSVYITNPRARALEENVYANKGKDGLWWFWWSWAERIAVVDDLDASATAITRVLALPRRD